MIARVVLLLRRLAVDVHPSNGPTTQIPKLPFRGVYLLLCNRGSFIFRLPSHKLRREDGSHLCGP
jgi:hypothetical protein